MTDVTVSAEAVEEARLAELKPETLDDQLISQLVERAQADGIKLTGEGGLLQQLTKRSSSPPSRARHTHDRGTLENPTRASDLDHTHPAANNQNPHSTAITPAQPPEGGRGG